MNKDDYFEDDFDADIYYDGYSDDGKIGVNNGGFYSYFFMPMLPKALKVGNYLSLMYYDKIAQRTVTKRISLAGFTRCYNQMK